MKFKKVLSLLLCTLMAVSCMAMPVSANAEEGKNPVIEGYYADPDIDLFDCKFWMYPTTDGITFPGWWGSHTFSAFSSDDMVNWKNEGVILDVSADTAEEAGVNEYGVQIAYSPWSSGYAWAPSIEKVGNMYYFYYVASVKDELIDKYCFTRPDGSCDVKAIGVAYSSSPNGPFTALKDPLITSKWLYEEMGQKPQVYGGRDLYCNVIDPSIFIDDDGTPYMAFGNTVPYIVELNKDMISIKENGLLKRMDGIPKFGAPEGFMEALVIFKRNDTYYFTWSVSGTSDPNYHISYTTSNSIDGKMTEKDIMLIKDESQSILGTGHHSVLYVPGNDTYYINYHRLCLDDNGKIIEPAGNFREVCIDKIEFDSNGKASAKPTHTGTGSVSPHCYRLTSKIEPTVTSQGMNTYTCSCGQSYTEQIAKLPEPVKPAPIPTSANTTVPTTTIAPTTKQQTTKTSTKKKPKTPKGLKLKKGKKQFKASWKKVSGVTGYQIQYSTDKKFKKGKKTLTVKGSRKTVATIKKLKSKKKYYVRIRAYKTSKGNKTYSSWTSKKSIKVK